MTDYVQNTLIIVLYTTFYVCAAGAVKLNPAKSFMRVMYVIYIIYMKAVFIPVLLFIQKLKSTLLRAFLAGIAGFEPACAGVKVLCLNRLGYIP